MFNQISNLGRSGLNFCQRVGESGIFLSRTLLRLPKLTDAFTLTVEQIYAVGVLSLIIIVIYKLCTLYLQHIGALCTVTPKS